MGANLRVGAYSIFPLFEVGAISRVDADDFPNIFHKRVFHIFLIRE